MAGACLVSCPAKSRWKLKFVEIICFQLSSFASIEKVKSANNKKQQDNSSFHVHLQLDMYSSLGGAVLSLDTFHMFVHVCRVGISLQTLIHQIMDCTCTLKRLCKNVTHLEHVDLHQIWKTKIQNTTFSPSALDSSTTLLALGTQDGGVFIYDMHTGLLFAALERHQVCIAQLFWLLKSIKNLWEHPQCTHTQKKFSYFCFLNKTVIFQKATTCLAFFLRKYLITVSVDERVHFYDLLISKTAFYNVPKNW